MSIRFVDPEISRVVWMIVQVSVLVAAAAIVHVCLHRRASAATRHLLWTFSIAALLLLPMFSVALPKWPIAIPAAGSTAAATAPIDAPADPSDVSVVPLNVSPTVATVGARPSNRSRAPTSRASRGTNCEFRPFFAGAAGLLGACSRYSNTLLAGSAPKTSTRIAEGEVQIGPGHIPYVAGPLRGTLSSSGRRPWAAVLPAVYAAGVLLLLLRLALERLSIRRLTRESTTVSDPEWAELLAGCARAMDVQRPVRLLRSVESIMPMTFGMRHAAILIPAVAGTWPADRRRAVLLHEMAHVSRQDCLTQTLAAVACALYWMHPGVWWIARRLRVERELACDDRVLAAGTEARDYAGHLLELGYALGGGRAPALAVPMASRRQLEGRMLAVLDVARNRATPAWSGRLAGVAITAALLVPVAAATTTVVPSDEDVPTSAPAFEPAQSAARARTDAQEPLPGTWEIRPSDSAGVVYMRISESDGFSGRSIAVERLDGLSPALLSGAGGSAAFSVRADAGTFTYEGILRNGVGAGTFTFKPNQSFADELAKRGLGRPTAAQQYFLAREDVGFGFLDELAAQGYERPNLVQLVRTAQHGVSLDYLRDMGRAGYRLGRVETLVNQRDHGVTPQFIRALAAEGFTRLSADDLVRARDHGVSPEYIRDLKALGHRSLTLDQLITLRDHGISPEFIRALDELGFRKLSLEILTAARDHGISPEYVREMRDLGHRLTLDELTRARDHGVGAEYIREMAALGYQRLSLETLIRLRDHGVGPEYVGELKRIGYAGLDIEELIGLRNQGVTPDRISRANARAGTRLSPERLKALAANGWR